MHIKILFGIGLPGSELQLSLSSAATLSLVPAGRIFHQPAVSGNRPCRVSGPSFFTSILNPPVENPQKEGEVRRVNEVAGGDG